MRVVHVITRLIVGGAQENTIASVLGLREKPGVQISLISGPTTGPEGSLEHELARVPGLLRIVPELVRPVHPLKDYAALRRLTGIFHELRPDIVHTHSGKAGILGRLAARRSGVPIIVHSIHGPSFGDFQGSLANYIFRAAERYAGRFTTHFIVVAQAMAEQYLEAGIGSTEQYTRIWSGIPLEPFLAAVNNPQKRVEFGLHDTDIVIGKIARFFELKGHDDLLKVAPELVRIQPRIKFLLVGDGILREQFQTRVRELNLTEHFVFTGLLPPSEIPQIIGMMDILVHLSRREGLARALAQALAAAKPVVAFDCAGAREVCLDGETGFLVRPGDSDGLTACLLKLANDPLLRQSMGNRGQALVRDAFPVQKMVDDQYALYEKLLTFRR